MGETSQGGRLPDEGLRSTAGVLRLPCRALGSLEDDEPHRKRIRNGPAQDSADERFVVVNDRQADGVQTGYRRIENLAAAERPKSLAQDCRRCKIQRWHRGPRSAGKPRRLIAPHHLNSCITLNQLAKPSCVAARSHGVNLGHTYNIRFCSQHWPITFGAQYGS
jgi:hypothetical protein